MELVVLTKYVSLLSMSHFEMTHYMLIYQTSTTLQRRQITNRLFCCSDRLKKEAGEKFLPSGKNTSPTSCAHDCHKTDVL